MRKYKKPLIRKISLVPEEAVLQPCKLLGKAEGPGPGGGNSCVTDSIVPGGWSGCRNKGS